MIGPDDCESHSSLRLLAIDACRRSIDRHGLDFGLHSLCAREQPWTRCLLNKASRATHSDRIGHSDEIPRSLHEAFVGWMIDGVDLSMTNSNDARIP